MGFSEADIIKTLIMVAALAVAIIGHEIMHGYVAYRYGDTTAKAQGRLSINPIKHIDPIGTIAVPALLFVANAPFLFGWAKPVPIDGYTVLRNGGYLGMVNVSLAGIAYNLVLAFGSAFFINNGVDHGILGYFLFQLLVYNVVLGVFNLLPIPPLDGSKAIAYGGLMMGHTGIARWMQKIEPYGMILLVIILATPLSDTLFGVIRAIITALL